MTLKTARRRPLGDAPRRSNQLGGWITRINSGNIPEQQIIRAGGGKLPTSATVPAEIASRLRFLAAQIHELGPRPLFELFCEIASGDEALARLEIYARLDAEFIRQFGGDQFQPNNSRGRLQ